MSETEKRNLLSKVALGNIPPDAIIINGIVVNVFTRKFVKKQPLWIKDGMIAYVGPDHESSPDERAEMEGTVLLPRLIAWERMG